MIRDYLFDIAKIIEGASNGDFQKVVAYSESLGLKLEAEGEIEAAKRMRQILGKSKASKVALARTGQSVPVPVDSESRIPVADEEYPQKGSVPVVLPLEARTVVEKFLLYFRAADRLISSGVGISPSMIIHGPPGVGKTQLAKYIASELGYPLITARSDALISSYLGSTAKNLRSLFDHAVSRPCVLFLDEFDAIAKMRDDDRELGELKRVVISLMQNIDAMGQDHVLLAATNHEHLLDAAIWRRFAYKLELPLPDLPARIELLENFFGGFADNLTVLIAAGLSNNMSGAQLRNIAEDAIRDAVIEDREQVTHMDVVSRFVGNLPLSAQVQAVREIDPSIFKHAILVGVFGISQSYVSQLLNKRDGNAA